MHTVFCGDEYDIDKLVYSYCFQSFNYFLSFPAYLYNCEPAVAATDCPSVKSQSKGKDAKSSEVQMPKIFA